MQKKGKTMKPTSNRLHWPIFFNLLTDNCLGDLVAQNNGATRLFPSTLEDPKTDIFREDIASFQPSPDALTPLHWKNPYHNPISYKIITNHHMPKKSKKYKYLSKYLNIATNLWSQKAKIKFRKVSDTSIADIKISFQQGDHGDGEPFHSLEGANGKYRALAHAFMPAYVRNVGSNIAGDLHFDVDEEWGIYGNRKRKKRTSLGITSETRNYKHRKRKGKRKQKRKYNKSLLFTVIHELGHSLGLSHNFNKSSVMYPLLLSKNSFDAKNLSLSNFDTKLIVDIYGQVTIFDKIIDAFRIYGSFVLLAAILVVSVIYGILHYRLLLFETKFTKMTKFKKSNTQSKSQFTTKSEIPQNRRENEKITKKLSPHDLKPLPIFINQCINTRNPDGDFFLMKPNFRQEKVRKSKSLENMFSTCKIGKYGHVTIYEEEIGDL